MERLEDELALERQHNQRLNDAKDRAIAELQQRLAASATAGTHTLTLVLTLIRPNSLTVRNPNRIRTLT